MCGALSLYSIHALSSGQQLTYGGAVVLRRSMELEEHEYLKDLC